jgi:hypothetical protein
MPSPMKLPTGPIACYPLDVPAGKHRCAWPFGEPGYRTCDDPGVVLPRSYSVEHMCIAYRHWADAKARWEAAQAAPAVEQALAA